MIIPKSQVLEAVKRCLAMNDNLDAAIEAVAQSLHLTPDTVRECVATTLEAA